MCRLDWSWILFIVLVATFSAGAVGLIMHRPIMQLVEGVRERRRKPIRNTESANPQAEWQPQIAVPATYSSA